MCSPNSWWKTTAPCATRTGTIPAGWSCTTPPPAELSLSGYSLSDRENDATKYPLPAITLAPGEYRVVFLSGKNRTAADGNLHTGFKVNGSETLYLFSGSTIVDSVSGAATSSNISKIKVGSAWEETELYSPGFENTEAGH